jgi:iron complex outermembrane recepter protein
MKLIRIKWSCILLVCAITNLLSYRSFAQSNIIDGQVVDSQQLAVCNAIVQVEDHAHHVIARTITDDQGRFGFNSVTKGSYILHFSPIGFRSEQLGPIDLGEEKPIHLDIALIPTADNQIIAVSADSFTEVEPTGSRLGLTPLQTPAAVDVVSNETLQLRGYDQIEDAVRSMPGASSGGNPADPSQFIVRGFVGNQVTLLRDGMYIGPANMVNREENSFNLQSVELLEGPGSVLYGQGAVGGTVNVLTKPPAFLPVSFDGYTNYGSFNTYEVGVGGGGQISKRVAFRGDFSYWSSNGYVEAANPNTLNGTGSFLWKICDNLSIKVALDAMKDNLSTYYGTPFISAAFGIDPLRGVLRTKDGTVLDARMRFKNYNVSNPDTSSISYQPSATIYWQPLSNLSITNSTYFYHAHRYWQNAETYTFLGPNNDKRDANGNPIPGNVIARDRFHVFHDQNLPGDSLNAIWSHPLFGLHNKLSGGYEHYNIGFVRSRGFPNAQYADYLDPINPNPGIYGSFAGDFPSSVSPTKITDNAGFFEDALDITQGLTLVTGIRFESFFLDRLNYDQNGAPQPANNFSNTYYPINYRAGLVYAAKSYLTVYGQLATGQDPPGDNIFLVNANENFRLSSSREVEVGLKSLLPEGRGEMTLALFNIERKNILSQTGQDLVSNVGNQKSRGSEFSMLLRPTDRASINFNAAYVDAKYGTFIDSSTGLDDSGNHPADVPALTTNLWANFRRVGSLALEVGGGWRFVGERFADNANQTKLFSYNTVDIYGIYHVTEKLAFTARGKNLLDKTYAQWADISYPSEIVLSSPRTFELSLTSHF